MKFGLQFLELRQQSPLVIFLKFIAPRNQFSQFVDQLLNSGYVPIREFVRKPCAKKRRILSFYSICLNVRSFTDN